MHDVAVIIVGYNAREYVLQCLSSLEKTAFGRYTHQVVYVDNASRDGSVEAVRSAFHDVEILANTENLGFCRACNQGAAHASSRYYFFLNNDTVLESDAIPQLIAYMDAMPSVAACGSRLLNPDMSDQWSARRFPSWRNAVFGRRSALARRWPNAAPVRSYLYKEAFASGQPFPVDWIPGSCTLARPAMHWAVGGFPVGLHYWSDAVYCYRLAQRGGDICIVPASRILHYEGKGSGKRSASAQRWHIRDFHRGAYRFHCEYHNLQRYSPRRWVAAALLAARAGLLIGWHQLQPLFHRAARTPR